MEKENIGIATEALDRRIERARTVPDVAGRDIGVGVMFLANGQALLYLKTRESFYFVD